MVGQWTKFDTHRRAVDVSVLPFLHTSAESESKAESRQVIAIKQAELDPREVDCQGNPTVPMEAMIMKALELQGCGNVSVLRTVRFFPGTREDGAKPRWRFYLDFYRHGTLHDLVGRYVEANSRRQPNQAYVLYSPCFNSSSQPGIDDSAVFPWLYVRLSFGEESKLTAVFLDRERIPEAFVWQAFNDLAQACYHMSIVRLDPSLEPPGRDFFVLHLDLKPDNSTYALSFSTLIQESSSRHDFLLTNDRACDIVLLGDPPSDPKKMNYPTLKIADWGMAEYTSVEDSKNSKQWKLHGTPRWYPPVSFYRDCPPVRILPSLPPALSLAELN